MDNKTVLFALALVASPPCAGIAAAADRLSEGQMDRVTAGSLTIDCSGCGNVSTSATSVSINGVTTTTSSNTGATGSGNTGGNGNSSGSGSGNTGGNGNGDGSSNGSNGPSVAFTISIPANLAAIINTATVVNH